MLKFTAYVTTLFLILVLPALASAKVVTFSSETGAPGDTVTVAISVDDINAIAGYNIDFTYDSEVLTITGAATGATFGGSLFMSNLDEPGVARLGLVGAMGNSGSGTGQLATVTFTINNTDLSSSPLTFTQVILQGETGALAGTASTNGSVGVTAPPPVAGKEVTFSSESGSPGETVIVAINVDDINAIAGYSIDFTYDSTVLTATGATSGAAFAGSLFIPNLVQSGVVRLALASTVGNSGSGPGRLATVAFTIKNTELSSSPLVFTQVVLQGPTGALAGTTSIDGSVGVTASPPVAGKEVTFNEESGSPGETVTVAINVDDINGIAGYNIDFTYDSTALTVTGATRGDAFTGALFIPRLVAPGVVQLALAGAVGHAGNGSGQLATVTFTINNTDLSSSPLTFTRVILQGETGTLAGTTSTDGSVGITEAVFAVDLTPATSTDAIAGEAMAMTAAVTVNGRPWTLTNVNDIAFVSNGNGTFGAKSLVDGKVRVDYTTSTTVETATITATEAISGKNNIATATVASIAGPLAVLKVQPDTANLTADETRQFTLSGTDINGNPVTSLGTITWSVNGGIGTIDDTGLLNATTVGQGTVTSTSSIGPVSDSSGAISITHGAIDHFAVTATRNTLYSQGKGLGAEVIATLLDADGNTVTSNNGTEFEFNVTAGATLLDLGAASAIAVNGIATTSTMTQGGPVDPATIATIQATSGDLIGAPGNVTFNIINFSIRVDAPAAPFFDPVTGVHLVTGDSTPSQAIFTGTGGASGDFRWSLTGPGSLDSTTADTVHYTAPTILGDVTHATLTLTSAIDTTGTLVDTVTIELSRPVLLGDVNDDHKVNAGDAIQILRYSAGLATFTEIQILIADVNDDHKVNAGDAIQILRYSAGLPSTLDQ